MSGMCGAAILSAGALLSWCAMSASAQNAPAVPAAPATVTPPTTARSAGPLVSTGLDEKTGGVRLLVNKSVTLNTNRPYKRLNVGQPDIAEVNAIGPSRILITGKKAGATQIILWDEDDNSQTIDVLVQGNVLALRQNYERLMPNAKIDVIDNDGTIVLTGSVPNLAVSDQAVALASGYGNKVLNLLEIAGGQQVMLQIRFAEVSKTAITRLGVNFAIGSGVATFGSNVETPNAFSPAEPLGNIQRSLPASGTLFGSGAIGGTQFEVFLSALRSNNLLRVLAEPNLVAISGQEADFLAGGDFPVPIVQGGNNQGTSITVEFREFGVRLKFTPVVLGDGRIRLRLEPEVSDVDFTFAVTAQGFRIPGRRTRRLSTTVELNEGETFAVGGLLDSRVASNKDAVPLLGDLPVLGALFRSVRYQRQETELVVLVTPRLVLGMRPGEVPKLPGEHWRHPNEGALFLNGDIGAPVDDATAAKIPARRFIGRYGFVPASEATPTPTPTATPAQ